jgi:hypothetical protein
MKSASFLPHHGLLLFCSPSNRARPRNNELNGDNDIGSVHNATYAIAKEASFVQAQQHTHLLVLFVRSLSGGLSQRKHMSRFPQGKSLGHCSIGIGALERTIGACGPCGFESSPQKDSKGHSLGRSNRLLDDRAISGMHYADSCFILHGSWSRHKTHEKGVERHNLPRVRLWTFGKTRLPQILGR